MEEITIIERAFELARTGACRSIEELDTRLRKERYTHVREHLSGSGIRKQLKEIIAAADKA